MLNKTIIVFYINVRNSSRAEADEIIQNVRKLIEPSESDRDNVIHYIIPVVDQDTRIECINNPIFLSSKEMEESVLKKMEAVNNKLDRIASFINASSESRQVIIEKQ